jgi:hypothetical protein
LGAFTPDQDPPAITSAESGANVSSGRHALDPVQAQNAASPIPEPQNAASNNLPDATPAPAPDHTTPGPVAEPQNAASDNSPQPAAALPADDTVEPSPGRLLRGAQVYSGPSTSSSLIGYAAPGSEIQLLERKSEWARVVDPATSRQGWVNSDDITLTETLSLAATTPRGEDAASDPNAGEPSARGAKAFRQGEEITQETCEEALAKIAALRSQVLTAGADFRWRRG